MATTVEKERNHRKSCVGLCKSVAEALQPADDSITRRFGTVWALSLWARLCQNRAMDKDHVISKLRAHQQELRAAGIVHLSVFGSVARDQASPRSDVDLLAEFDKSKPLTLVSVGSLQGRLANILGAEVDLSSEDWMREPVRTRALSEAVLAF
jgi:predicted nucleotidyltransferase